MLPTRLLNRMLVMDLDHVTASRRSGINTRKNLLLLRSASLLLVPFAMLLDFCPVHCPILVHCRAKCAELCHPVL